MRISRKILLLALVGSALVAFTAPVADAGAARSSAQTPNQRLAALKARASALADRIEELSAETQTLERSRAAAPQQPSLTVSGDFTGTFPTLQLASATVGSPQIVDRSIQSIDIADGSLPPASPAPTTVPFADRSIVGSSFVPNSVGPQSIQPFGLGRRNLTNSIAYPNGTPPGVRVTAGGRAVQAVVHCPPGARLLAGGYEWANYNGDGAVIVRFAQGATQDAWEIVGKIEAGGDDNVLFAEALCLDRFS
jgi:hypothetical protein